jgi:hypothetical protein
LELGREQLRFRWYQQQSRTGGTGGWDLFCFLDALKPNTPYSAVFVRYAVDVRGDLDHEEILVTGSVTEPDSLVLLGGAPGGYPDQLCDFDPARTTFTIGVTGNQNPFNVGYVDTDAAGDLVFDCLIGSGGFWADEDLDAEGAEFGPVASNLHESSPQHRYNYLEIYEGISGQPDGSFTTPPAMRFQIGTELTAAGDPINNAYAPMPLVALSQTDLGLIIGSVSRADSVTFELENLKLLAGTAAYQVWAALDDGSMMGLDFWYIPPHDPTDTLASVDTTLVTSFKGGVSEWPHTIILEYPDNALDIVFSIESTAGATTVSTSQIFWTPGSFTAGQPKSLDLPVNFGTFSEGRFWAVAGTGSGGLFGTEFRERYGTLPRPPVGYKYVAWVMSGDSLAMALPDASFTTPPPEYAPLADADTDLSISNLVQPSLILAAFTRICLTTGIANCTPVANYADFGEFALVLEPKLGEMDTPGPTAVLEGLLPEATDASVSADKVQ